MLWTGIASLSEIAGDGSYYLTNAVTLDEKWVCSYDVNICLNGYSITADGDFDAIEVGAGKSFTLSDCNGTNGQYMRIGITILSRFDQSLRITFRRI